MFVCVYRQFVDLSQRREKKKNCGFWWLPIRFFRRWFRLSPKVSRRATAIFVLFYFVLTLFGLFCFFLIASWLSVSQLCVSLPDWMESNITHTHTHANNGKIKIKKNFLFFSFLPHLCFFRPIRRDGLVDSSDFPPPFFYTEWNEKKGRDPSGRTLCRPQLNWSSIDMNVCALIYLPCWMEVVLFRVGFRLCVDWTERELVTLPRIE